MENYNDAMEKDNKGEESSTLCVVAVEGIYNEMFKYERVEQDVEVYMELVIEEDQASLQLPVQKIATSIESLIPTFPCDPDTSDRQMETVKGQLRYGLNSISWARSIFINR